MWTRAFTLCASIALLSLAHTAVAQRGGTGAFSGGGLGSSGFGGMGGGMGSSGFGGMGGGMGSSGFGGMGGGMGSSGFGGMGGGMGGMGSSGFGNSGFGGGGGMGNSGFGGAGMGGINQPGGAVNFVGRGAQQNGMNQGNRQMNQFFTNMNRSMSRGNKNQKGKSGASQNPPQPMRMEVKVGFDPPQITSNAVATVIQTRMTKILADHHMSQPLITVQGDTAVITGDAKSESERQTIGQLVSLESGIRAVRNEMTAPDAAASPPSADTPPQPGS
jgi:hypothetical protein